MAGEETTNQQPSNIRQEYNVARAGMNLDQSVQQVQRGQLTYALNAAVDNFDGSSINYQNEPGNTFCLDFPQNYRVIGHHFVQEKNMHIFFLTNPDTGDSEIGWMVDNDCTYTTYINAPCLNFDINYPIHKCVHKITNCNTEIYWTDGLNPRRYLNLNEIPYVVTYPGNDICDAVQTSEIDCNKLNVQPNFQIPQINIEEVNNGGNLTAGVYQFAIQYCSASGDGYTSYYSVTNPTPIADVHLTTNEFNYTVGKSIVLQVDNLDLSGYFGYYNIAVIKTVNGASVVELLGTFDIQGSTKRHIYSGENAAPITLSMSDIFEKQPYYEVANDVTSVQDILIWSDLKSDERVNYQSIANNIQLQWESYRIPATENYSNPLNATNLRGYLRDEIYPFEIVFLKKNGQQTDGFHIPGRQAIDSDLALINKASNDDYIGTGTSSPTWKIYNTASIIGYDPQYVSGSSYKGPYQYGNFGYWESSETYPCDVNLWGPLAGQPIRHHRFPDASTCPIFETTSLDFASPVMQNRAIFSLGVKIDPQSIQYLINQSNLTAKQKSEIVGFKIVRGDRSANSSIVAKGIFRNVGKYTREGTDYYYPNYPYNDLNTDPFLLTYNNAYSSSCITYQIKTGSNGSYQYKDCFTGEIKTVNYTSGATITQCSASPIMLNDSLSSFIAISGPTYTLYCDKPSDVNPTTFQYNDPSSGNSWITVYPGSPKVVTSNLTPPVYFTGCSTYTITPVVGYPNKYTLTCSCTPTVYSTTFSYTSLSTGQPTSITVNHGSPISIASSTPPYYTSGSNPYSIYVDASYVNKACYPDNLNGFTSNTDSTFRYVFNSPETSFGQPTLGNVVKMESALFGGGKAHFVQVKKNAEYKLLTESAQRQALLSSFNLANSAGTFNPTAMFTAYQAYLQIYINGITRKNYAYSFNSIASYDYAVAIPTGQGVMQRNLDLCQYLIPGVQSVGDTNTINNFQRESSLYLKTDGTVTCLPYAQNTPNLKSNGNNLIIENSRFTISSSNNCTFPEELRDIKVVSYYGAIKNIIPDQWGQIYSYNTIDTGYQYIFNNPTSDYIIFGGDTFVGKFAFKTKLPFFIDNRVGAPDDSDVYYDELGNVAYPQYWHSSRSIIESYNTPVIGGSNSSFLNNIISIKAHTFDCPTGQSLVVTSAVSSASNPDTVYPSGTNTYYDGKFYLFAYGIPYYYVESSINVDLRQAFNNQEGDFYPHVSTGIPDNWLQQSVVPISFDNTYTYNVTYSKQNKENYFSHLPIDWADSNCFIYYPFRAIYSEQQSSNPNIKVNSWLNYPALNMNDFPQTYGKLTSLDGVQNKAILARFENKSLLYNTMLTMQTSNPQAAYLGNPTLFKSAPPVDFAETDLGFVGSQNKFLLKIPQGQITVDAKRGQIFLLVGQQAIDLSQFGSGMNRFFTDHLAFEILRYFPNVNVDNHFNGIGLHGVYDSKYDRFIITKLDYIPQPQWVGQIHYDIYAHNFYVNKVYGTTTLKHVVQLTDTKYFCNKSWTLSYDTDTKSWISFHTYLPNFYIGENNFFYSGLNSGCDINAVAAVEIPNTTTTTTTIHILDCAVAGTVYIPDNCLIIGSVTRV